MDENEFNRLFDARYEKKADGALADFLKVVLFLAFFVPLSPLVFAFWMEVVAGALDFLTDIW